MPSITLTFSAAHAQRIQAALEEVYSLEVPATVDDLKNYIITDVKQLVRNAEREIARRAALSGSTDVDIT